MTSRVTAASRNALIDTLLADRHWSGTVTWSVSAVVGAEYAGTVAAAPPPHLRGVVASVLGDVAACTNLSFRETGAGATVRVFTGERLSFSDAGRTTTIALGGYAFFPGDTALAGDVWLGSSVVSDLSPGTFGWRTLLHEIGHALGLKQPDEAGPFGRLPAALDGAEWSVMSARGVTGGPVGNLGLEPTGYAETFTMRDIAALQHLYGANFSDHRDDVYQFDPFDRVMSRTIWDGGGRDTYDFSRYVLSVSIDLEPGRWSTTGQEAQLNRAAELATGAAPIYAAGSIYNAFLHDGDWRSGIENAVGGSGNDTVSGNLLRNVLHGGPGNDSLLGHGGRDVLYGDLGDDTLHGGAEEDLADGGAGDDVVYGGAGDDTLFGGAGNDILSGFWDDALPGGAWDETLSGLDGNDLLYGGRGDDTLRGGPGTDVMTGGPGADVFEITGRSGADVITDFNPGEDRLDVDDPAAVYASARASGGDTILVVGPGRHVIHLLGVDPLSLEIDDFI